MPFLFLSPRALCAEATLPVRRVTQSLHYVADYTGSLLFVPSEAAGRPASLAPVAHVSRNKLRVLAESANLPFKWKIISYGANALLLPSPEDPVWEKAAVKALEDAEEH